MQVTTDCNSYHVKLRWKIQLSFFLFILSMEPCFSQNHVTVFSLALLKSSPPIKATL